VPDIATRKERLVQITGQIPDPGNLPDGCPFDPRCPEALTACKDAGPLMVEIEEQHFVRCFKQINVTQG
jgi:peptide/nickel transport system ATP-binding protein